MEVKGVEYYHIHRIGPQSTIWIIGNRINWVQKRKNLFYDFYNQNGFFYDDGTGKLPYCQAINRFLLKSPEMQAAQAINIIKATAEIVHQQAMFIREQVFEEVRINYFPHLPSRQTCVWVCPHEAVEFWWNTLKESQCKILKLKLTGSLFITDQRHLIADTLRHDDFRAKAFEYWTGSDGLAIADQEILFEGIIDVVAEFANLEQFSNANSTT